ncbi:hypothetical protein AVEN_127732-1 [Araneus ventricosus]|uniref:Uncharacterized protein n=1 Tax=Araneus ventricosus TaxID=182803 RepID=A0A4Y2PB43_ARAVE|nr:hypothetical protein AVEN_127732-1 [Araneus ventricosus]
MLIFWQERELYGGFTGGQANEPRPWRPFWRLRRQNEASREYRDYLYWERKFREPSTDFYATSHPIGKAFNDKQFLKSVLPSVLIDSLFSYSFKPASCPTSM